MLVDGIAVEAPLEGTMIVVSNRDEPGVIGEIGTILGRHGVNIANFALGRNGGHAIGVVIVDETAPIPDDRARGTAARQGDSVGASGRSEFVGLNREAQRRLRAVAGGLEGHGLIA